MFSFVARDDLFIVSNEILTVSNVNWLTSVLQMDYMLKSDVPRLYSTLQALSNPNKIKRTLPPLLTMQFIPVNRSTVLPNFQVNLQFCNYTGN